MTNLNRVILIGTVPQKPETRFGLEGGTSFSKFTVVVERPARQDGTTNLDYIPVIAFGKMAEYSAENLNQNSQVIVEGSIQNRSIDKEGQRVWVTEVVASNLKLLGAKNVALSASVKEPVSASDPAMENMGQNPFDGNFTEDDVPF